MARGKYLTDVERDAIRIGVKLGLNAPAIANYLGRTRDGIHKEIKRLKNDGTIDDMPLSFLVDAVGRDMQRVEADRQRELAR